MSDIKILKREKLKYHIIKCNMCDTEFKEKKNSRIINCTQCRKGRKVSSFYQTRYFKELRELIDEFNDKFEFIRLNHTMAVLNINIKPSSRFEISKKKDRQHFIDSFEKYFVDVRKKIDSDEEKFKEFFRGENK